jgi:hypothetical protein
MKRLLISVIAGVLIAITLTPVAAAHPWTKHWCSHHEHKCKHKIRHWHTRSHTGYPRYDCPPSRCPTFSPTGVERTTGKISCRAVSKTHRAIQTLWPHLVFFKVHARTGWCWSRGKVLRGTHYFDWWLSNVQSLWGLKSQSVQKHYYVWQTGRRRSGYYYGLQIHMAVCIVGEIGGCIQNGYPWQHFHLHGNGTFTSNGSTR